MRTRSGLILAIVGCLALAWWRWILSARPFSI